jgi:hypothetical protein
MFTKILILVIAIAVALIALGSWRWSDKYADQAVWTALAAHQPTDPASFDVTMLEGLPAPAQRYFSYAIRPGTPLTTVVEISMQGQFSLGSKTEPNYLPMRAQQILAAPHGFVWQLNAGNGFMRLTGSDAAVDGNSWSRFWLLDLVPVARAGANSDHARSAFGRYVAEAVFWTPAAILPGNQIRWEAIDESTARVTVTHLELEQSVDLTIDAEGKLSKVSLQRWSNTNSAQTFRLQPFGGYLSEYRDFNGFRLPTRIEAGNFFETDSYFPFFRVNVTAIQVPQSHGD